MKRSFSGPPADQTQAARSSAVLRSAVARRGAPLRDRLAPCAPHQGHPRTGLQEIPGVGPSRKRALLHHFGTLKAIERASLADLAQVTGINDETARKIYDFFHEGAPVSGDGGSVRRARYLGNRGHDPMATVFRDRRLRSRSDWLIRSARIGPHALRRPVEHGPGRAAARNCGQQQGKQGRHIGGPWSCARFRDRATLDKPSRRTGDHEVGVVAGEAVRRSRAHGFLSLPSVCPAVRWRFSRFPTF